MNKARVQRSFDGKRWMTIGESLLRVVLKNHGMDPDEAMAGMRGGAEVVLKYSLLRWQPALVKMTHAAMVERYGERECRCCRGCAHYEDRAWGHGHREHCKASGGWLAWRGHWMACGKFKEKGG